MGGALRGSIDQAAALPGKNYWPLAIRGDSTYPPIWLPEGWVALRLDLANLDWDEAAELAVTIYRLIAPKRLATAAKKPRGLGGGTTRST
jgi:hypothetical protein